MQTIDFAGRIRPESPYWMWVLLVVASSALSGGCGGGGGEAVGTDASTVSVTDSSGVPLVINRGSGWASEAAWRLEPDLQVGEIDGPLAFGRINWVTPGPDNGLLVLDGQSHLVHLFDSEGRFIRSFGGEGDGPGEFRRPASITALADGRIAVGEGFPPVLHWLTAAGKYLSSTRLPIARDEAGTRTAGSFGVWQVTTSGQVFVQVQVIDPGADDGQMPVVLLTIEPEEASSPDTVARWTWSAGFGDRTIRVFEAVPTWMPRSDGVVVLSRGVPYEIEWRNREGLVRTARRDMAPLSVTARHRELEMSRMRDAMSQGGAPGERIDELIDNMEFESTLPDVFRVWVSEPDGRLWIGVHDAELFAEADSPLASGWANALDVFERDGRYLGRIPIPNGFSLRVVTENALYGVWEDDLEVPFARRYRVIRAAGD